MTRKRYYLAFAALLSMPCAPSLRAQTGAQSSQAAVHDVSNLRQPLLDKVHHKTVELTEEDALALLAKAQTDDAAYQRVLDLLGAEKDKVARSGRRSDAPSRAQRIIASLPSGFSIAPTPDLAAAVFDGSVLRGDRSMRVVPSAMLLPRSSGCDPRTDPDCDTAAPQQPKPKVKCTPGSNCPGDKPAQRSCNPNLDPDCGSANRTDSSGSSSGGAVYGGERGGAPSGARQAPNYKPRPSIPSTPPRTFPPVGSIPYDSSRVDVAGYWHEYSEFGLAHIAHGDWQSDNKGAAILRGGKESGIAQNTRYIKGVSSSQYRNTYRLYWRYHYLGSDCDPNNSDLCREWTQQVEYHWFYDGTEQGRSTGLLVTVEIADDKPLLPWAKDSIGITFNGSQVGVDQSGAAFVYQVDGPIINQGNNTATIVLRPGAIRPQAAEDARVNLFLRKTPAGKLQIVVEDARRAFYNGETLEIAVTVKKQSGSRLKSDPKVTPEFTREHPARLVINKDWPQQTIDVGDLGPGSYYLTGSSLLSGDYWSFRRAESAISTGEWHKKWNSRGNPFQF